MVFNCEHGFGRAMKCLGTCTKHPSHFLPRHPGYSSSLKTTPTYHIPQMPTYEDIPGLSTLSADVPIKKVKNLVKKKPGLVAPNNIYMLLPDDDAGDSVNFFKSTDIRLVK